MRQVSFFFVSFVCNSVSFKRSPIYLYMYTYMFGLCGARILFLVVVALFLFIRRYSLVWFGRVHLYIWIGFTAFPFIYAMKLNGYMKSGVCVVSADVQIHFSMVCLTSMVGAFFVHHSVNSVRTRICFLLLLLLFFSVCLFSILCVFFWLQLEFVLWFLIIFYYYYYAAVGCTCICEVHFGADLSGFLQYFQQQDIKTDRSILKYKILKWRFKATTMTKKHRSRTRKRRKWKKNNVFISTHLQPIHQFQRHHLLSHSPSSFIRDRARARSR